MEVLSYDGTFNGFLSVLLYLLRDPKKLSQAQVVNLKINPNSAHILMHQLNYSREEISKFYNYLKNSLEPDFFKKLFLYYLCDGAKIEIHVARAIYLSKKNSKIYKDLTQEDIIKLYQAEKAFFRERHRFLGLLRFIELPDKTLVATFKPKYNVLPKLYSHFLRRFINENFIIFDALRNLVFFYRNKKGRLVFVEGLELEINYEVDPLVRLWKKYFDSIAVSERINLERQRQRLPLRFREFLPEFLDIKSKKLRILD